MKVISVDVAPQNSSTICGRFSNCYKKPAFEMAQHCRELAEEDSILVCWDAPLTGPPRPDAYIAEKSAYWWRIIERFFSPGSTYAAPTGISVLPYSGCPHWTITRASIGLPRLGRFDLHHESLPFLLVHSRNQIKELGQYVVEIHPAVAIWLWCRNSHTGPWNYKEDDALRDKLWEILCDKWAATRMAAKLNVAKLPKPKDHDELDAIVGWVLGVLLINNDPSVEILGDELTGSFVLPVDDCLLAAFKKFSDKKKKELKL